MKYGTKNTQTPTRTQVIIYIFCVVHFFLFLLSLNFCASSTTGISIYSGTITGKIVLNLNRSMKDLFFVRLHTLILCPNFLDAQKGRVTKLKKDATNYICRTCL